MSTFGLLTWGIALGALASSVGLWAVALHRVRAWRSLLRDRPAPILGRHASHAPAGSPAPSVGIGPDRGKPVIPVDKIISLGNIPAGINIGTGGGHMPVNHYTAVGLDATAGS